MFSRKPQIDSSVLTDIAKILDSGILSGYRGTPEGHSGGDYVQRLETEFRDYFGVRHALALNSATAGLHVALIALGIGVGDEVIVTPYSFSASASCVLMAGATPVFVDIEDETFNIDPSKIEDAITPNTRAIIPVHLHGHPADMNRIMDIASDYGLAVIEDAAQAITAEYYGQYVGTIGECGIFSFNQSKHICAGEGGMLITDDDEIAEKVQAVRNHGEISSPELQIVGYNYRMCEIEAALALEQFRTLDEQIKKRIELTNYLSEKLRKIEGFTPPVTKEDCKHVFYTYSIKYDETITGIPREKLQSEMLKRGFYFGGHYVKPIYWLPIFGEQDVCPVVENIWDKVIVTDIIKPPATLEDIDMLIKALKEIV